MSIVGEAKVFNINDECLNTISIKKSFGRYQEEIFEAYIESDKLGKIEVQWLRIAPNLLYISELNRYGVNRDSELEGYGFETTAVKLNKVLISNLWSYENKKYKGIGTALMQVAIESGLRKRCEGRLIICPCYGSHGFWYKQGMRATKEIKIDETIAKRLEEAKLEQKEPDTEDLSEQAMYLPSDEIANWITKIESKPILFSTRIHEEQ